MVQVTFDMNQLNQVFERFSQRMNGLPMEIIGESISTSMLDFLESEGDGGWKSLSPATLRRRPRRRGGKLLQDRGKLKAYQVETGSDWVEVRSPADYAGFHVTGTINMPKRDPLDINIGRALETAAVLVAQELTTI